MRDVIGIWTDSAPRIAVGLQELADVVTSIRGSRDRVAPPAPDGTLVRCSQAEQHKICHGCPHMGPHLPLPYTPGSHSRLAQDCRALGPCVLEWNRGRRVMPGDVTRVRCVVCTPPMEGEEVETFVPSHAEAAK